MIWIIVGLLSIVFLTLLLFLASRGTYTYKFEERTVKAAYLEEARSKLFNHRSPLIETDDPTII